MYSPSRIVQTQCVIENKERGCVVPERNDRGVWRDLSPLFLRYHQVSVTMFHLTDSRRLLNVIFAELCEFISDVNR